MSDTRRRLERIAPAVVVRADDVCVLRSAGQATTEGGVTLMTVFSVTPSAVA